MNEKRTFGGQVRTIGIVTLITVMVWLLAESRMVRTQTLEAQVVLTVIESAGRDRLVVRQAMGNDGLREPVRTVSIDVEGSTAGIDRFARALQNQVELRVGRDFPATRGIHPLDIQALLRDSTEMKVHGLIITDVSPSVIQVEVDELETREFPVRVLMPDGVELDGAPRAEPTFVRVTAPMGVLAGIEGDEAYVRVDQSEIVELAQGRLETIPGLVIELSGVDQSDWATLIEPIQVDVLVTVRTLTENVSIARLPVQVLMAPDGIGNWRVVIDDADKDLVNVMFEGPAEGIALLKSGEVRPRAIVDLSFEDLGRRIRSKSAQILGLPPGCRVVSPDFTVNLVISPIDEPAGTTGSPPTQTP